jgi:putative transposase
MRDWYSAQELAGLPGLPRTDSAVMRLAKKDGWPTRKKAQGKGYEYPLSALPDAARAALIAESVQAAAATLPAVLADRPRPLRATEAELVTRVPESFHALADWQRAVLNARVLLLGTVERLAVDKGWDHALAQVAHLAAAGQLTGLEALGGHLPARATLRRWARRRARYGSLGLAPLERHRAATPAWLAPLLALYQRPQKPSVAAALRDLQAQQPTLKTPPLRSAERWLAKLPAEIRERGRMGPRAIRAVLPFVRRSLDGLWPMDVVVADGHLFKAYVRHPTAGSKVRPELTVYLDVATRKAVGFSAWLAESQYSIWLALRDMILAPGQGIPALHYSDNGAYTGERHRALLERLGTDVLYSQPYRAQARGVIERFNSSVWVPLAKTLPTYVGDDADAEYLKRQLVKADQDAGNLPGWDDFLATARAALAAYNAKPHRTLKGKCPDQAWADAVAAGWQPTALEDEDLHELLPAVTRTVARGEVSLPWGRYFAAHLPHGTKVRVAFDPADGAKVWVMDEAGRLLALAERAANAKPFVSFLDHSRQVREAGRVQRLERKLELVRAEEAPVLIGEPITDPVIVIPARDAYLFEPRPDEAAAQAAWAAEWHRPRDPLDDLERASDADRYDYRKQLLARRAGGALLSAREEAFVELVGSTRYCQLSEEMEAEYAAALAARDRQNAG